MPQPSSSIDRPPGFARVEPAVIACITGADRLAWLHNFCTADIRRLQPGDGHELFILNVKGKTLAHAIVLATDDEILLVMIGKPEVSIVEHLDRYIFREDVTIRDATSELAVWWANDIPQIAERFATTPADWSHNLTSPHGARVVAATVTATRDWLVLDERRRAETTVDWMENTLELAPRDAGFLERARIANQWPLNGREITSARFPQELSRNSQAISFTKGCYLGQETVARIDALGHVNFFLARFSCDSSSVDDAAGMELAGRGENGKKIGQITSAVQLDSGELDMLGFVRSNQIVDGAVYDSPLGAVRLCANPSTPSPRPSPPIADGNR